MSGAVSDLRCTMRRLRGSPMGPLAAALCLALGIGASTLAWSLLDALMLRPPPGVVAPDRLFVPHALAPDRPPPPFANFGHDMYEELTRGDGAELYDLAAYSTLEVALAHGEAPELLRGLSVSPNFFSVLGAHAHLGAPIGLSSPPDAVVLGFDLWRRRFDGRSDLIGARVRLAGEPFTVVGVATRGFTGPMRSFSPELFVPLESHHRIARMGGAMIPGRTMPAVLLFGRLSEGVSLERAAAPIAAVIENRPGAKERGVTARLYPLREAMFGVGETERVLRYPIFLAAGLGLVLFIASFNLANLFAARHAARTADLAVRSSLGARRRDLVRLLLLESGVVVGAGVSAGIALARLGLPVLARAPLLASSRIEPAIGLRVLALGVGTAILVGVLVGLVPALRFSAIDLSAAIRTQTAGHDRARRGWSGDLAVAAQVAIATIVLIAAGLLLRTSRNLHRVDTGFDPDNVLIAAIDLDPKGTGIDSVRARSFFDELSMRIAALPGVASVSTTSSGEPLGGVSAKFSIKVPGVEGDGPLDARHAIVGPRYFATLGIPLLRGRDFASTDAGVAHPVIVVNEAFAERFWPGENAIGKTVGLMIGASRAEQLAGASNERSFEIIGVVANAKDRGLRDEPPSFVYLADAQHEAFAMMSGFLMPRRTVLVRTHGDPEAMLPMMRAVVTELDPALPLYNVTTLEERVRASRALETQAARIFSVFSVTALLAALLGVWSLSRYAAQRRRVEVGVRMALGAVPADILALLLRRGFVLSVIGCGLGLAIAAAGSRLVERFLYEVEPLDPATFALAAATLLAATLLGWGFPAREAARADPSRALRDE